MRSLAASAVAALFSCAVFGAQAESWNYQGYFAGKPSGPGEVVLETTSDGKSTVRLIAGRMDDCYRTALDADVAKTEEAIAIIAKPRMAGCDEIRFVIKNDGSGARREVKKGDQWV